MNDKTDDSGRDWRKWPLEGAAFRDEIIRGNREGVHELLKMVEAQEERISVLERKIEELTEAMRRLGGEQP